MPLQEPHLFDLVVVTMVAFVGLLRELDAQEPFEIVIKHLNELAQEALH
jgi:hypothetical protein